MKSNIMNLLSAVIIALALVFCSVYIGSKIESTSAENTMVQSILMNKEEAAGFLGIPLETFTSMLKREKIERYNVTTYPTYQFIPYMNVDGEMYFSREELLKWVEYQSHGYKV